MVENTRCQYLTTYAGERERHSRKRKRRWAERLRAFFSRLDAWAKRGRARSCRCYTMLRAD
eukprot:1195287-Pyramimonas_sp.AAC.1